MQYLSVTDYAVMGVYFCVLVGLGLYLRKMASASLEDYFLGGKRLPWWALGISGMASFLDITGTMIIVSFLYMLGPRGLFIEFRGGAALVLPFLMIWAGKWHRRSNCMTGAEWMIYRFGSGPGGQAARIVTAIATMIFPVGMLAYMIKGIGPFLATFLPWSPMVCAAILISIAMIYTMASGFYGVVFTDIFQSGIILIAVLTISTMAFLKVTDCESLALLAHEVTGSPNWLSATPHFHTPTARGYEQYEALFMFATFYLMKNTFMGMGGGDDPKYYGARNERECGILTFLWTWLMMFRWPMMMGFAVLGLFLVKDLFPDQNVVRDAELEIKRYLVQQQHPGMEPDLENTELIERVIPKAQWADTVANIANNPTDHPKIAAQLQDMLGDKWPDKLKLVSYEGTVDPERILPAVLLFNIPKGLRGLLLIALIAACMSTFDTTVNRSTGFFTRDVYQAYLRPKASNRELIYASYGFILVLVLCGFGFGLTTKSINDIWGWIIMSFTAGLAIPAVLRLYWWRFNAGGMVGATVVGLIASFVQRAIWPGLDERIQFIAMSSIALAGAIIGTYVTRPTDPKVLEHFYRTTRPFGLWGRFKRQLPPNLRATTTREHRNDILALPFGLGWQITLFLLPMELIVHNFQAFWWTLVIFIICLIGLYVFWYRNLPATDVVTTPTVDSPNNSSGPVCPER